MVISRELSMNIPGRLAQLARQTPEKAAIIFRDGRAGWRTVTYRSLNERAGHYAAGLSEHGLRPGARVAVMVPAGVEFIALAFALLKAGLVPVLVDPAMGLGRLGRCLDDAAPEAFIGNGITHLLRRWYGWGRRSVRTNLHFSALRRQVGRSPAALNSAVSSSPNAEAAVIFTSGSTGPAKGAVYTHGNLSAILDALVSSFGIQQDEVDLPAFPLFLMIDCLLGVTAIVPDTRFPAPARVNPELTIDAANRFGATNMFASPVVLDRLARHAKSRALTLNTMKRVITAGAPAPFRVLRQFTTLLPADAALYGIYGATEALLMSTVDYREALQHAPGKTARGAGICVGRPLPDACVRIISITDDPIPYWSEVRELPRGSVGEITATGNVVAPRYVGDSDANLRAKICDGSQVVHRTGDLGYMDDDGLLWYCGRKTHRVETRGGTLFTEQIEGIFNAHPRVYRTALVGVHGRPVLWVELEKEARGSDRSQLVSELRELGRTHPQATMVEDFLFANRFPTDVRHNSKIIREELAARAARRLH